jgi:ketosteroid isomerase-like protein
MSQGRVSVSRVSPVILGLVMSGLLTMPFMRAAGQEESEAAQVRALDLKLTEAYKQRKFDLLASLLDEDFVITFEDGSTYGKTGYISYSAATTTRVDVAEMSDMKVRMHGNTAVLTGVYHERGVEKGAAYDYRDRFTDVWMKSEGKWRMIASHYAIPLKP